MVDFLEFLRNTSYPGRGILVGKDRVYYFIMGRSENSRNRVFVKTGDGIRTEAHDPAKLADPSLIIYHPVRTMGSDLVVTNGDQTDTIAEAFREGKSFVRALRTREFEPDGPNWTPRISGVVRPDGGYKLSILKSADGDSACCERFFFEYGAPIPGTGHFISTYETDGDPLPSFRGEPKAVSLGNEGVQALADQVWAALNADNKVSLFVRTVELETGKIETAIINKHQA